MSSVWPLPGRVIRLAAPKAHHILSKPLSCRWQSSLTSIEATPEKPIQRIAPAQDSCLSRMPTWSLMRSVIISTFLTNPILFKPGLRVMTAVANSKSLVLNPDRNPLLRMLIKPFVYDQFCAGIHEPEIRRTIKSIKHLGFSGVILQYAKEIAPGESTAAQSSQATGDPELDHWVKGNLETLDMVDSGNWLGIKFTGAGQLTTEALVRGDDATAAFMAGMDKITEKANERGCRIWIDSEMQSVQAAIDRWTIDLMRKHNRGGMTPIYNTVQAYLKGSRPKLLHQLQLAEKEGWTMAFKLVRGAYMAIDKEGGKIHDTKADTDASYDGIVHDMLTGRFEGYTRETFPRTRLFLAGHNSETIRTALRTATDLDAEGKLNVAPEFGQLMGMADDIGCEIVQYGDKLEAKYESEGKTCSASNFVPRVYKCLQWGTIQECMLYLVRRAVENAAAVERIGESARQARKELWRRMFLIGRRKVPV